MNWEFNSKWTGTVERSHFNVTQAGWNLGQKSCCLCFKYLNNIYSFVQINYLRRIYKMKNFKNFKITTCVWHELNMFLTRETGRTKISGWRRGAVHVGDEDVTLETRGGSRSSGDEGRRRVEELWTTTLICPQQSLYVMSHLLLLYRLRPSPGCPHMVLLVWTSRTRQPAAASDTSHNMMNTHKQINSSSVTL